MSVKSAGEKYQARESPSHLNNFILNTTLKVKNKFKKNAVIHIQILIAR